MKKTFCDRCGHEAGPPYGDIHEVAFTHWDVGADRDVEEITPNLDLCGKCRTGLKKAVSAFVKET